MGRVRASVADKKKSKRPNPLWGALPALPCARVRVETLPPNAQKTQEHNAWALKMWCRMDREARSPEASECLHQLRCKTLSMGIRIFGHAWPVSKLPKLHGEYLPNNSSKQGFQEQWFVCFYAVRLDKPPGFWWGLWLQCCALWPSTPSPA